MCICQQILLASLGRIWTFVKSEEQAKQFICQPAVKFPGKETGLLYVVGLIYRMVGALPAQHFTAKFLCPPSGFSRKRAVAFVSKVSWLSKPGRCLPTTRFFHFKSVRFPEETKAIQARDLISLHRCLARRR